jgi:hypothetical protein
MSGMAGLAYSNWGGTFAMYIVQICKDFVIFLFILA